MKRSARLAACLVASLATASCTSSGVTPPAEVGASGPTAQMSPSLAPTTSTTLAAPSPGLAASPQGTPNVVPSGSGLSQAPEGTQASTALPQGNGGQASAITASRIELAPITGATSQVTASLDQRLWERARQRGIGIADKGAFPTHILKGYFSEVDDGSSTTVIYVWDVLDPSGSRLHRIQGQAKAKGKGGWAAVPARTMQEIADHTIDEFARWLSSRTAQNAPAPG
ncbi:hypothetical protein SAZ10_11165 [Mesorhizobium sp. BAC0120]|uniref:hypothetical protein n=1 Tax=Mesorhizobium sp. BAC0120 TaxID=3090670 RepID=UPI00298D2B15|nr:hypothetical protein [Mesorhizobium sp. BAC0120]MDW6022312.1 hypothetical protein [Mesorhizobium sp. BAC0120]